MKTEKLKKKAIPFNTPYFSGKELSYIEQAFKSGKISGNGFFTKKCHEFFEKNFGFNKVLLTTSCTDALEMSAILAEIHPGDEVIMPSFTFPSTANAFVLRGAKIVFADSEKDNPNLDVSKLPALITDKTKAIVPVHYAGIACDMDPVMEIARMHNLIVIEDAAQAVDSYYKGEALGKIGHLGTFSFHETKNISSGEGGLLTINDKQYAFRSEIIWEKGTNRSAFFRGEVKKYGWVDIGSSYLPSDVIAALLYAQLEKLESIQQKRREIWQQYFEGLKSFAEAEHFALPYIPKYATNNAHMFYIICRSLEERTSLIAFLKRQGISAIFHYLPLHQAEFYVGQHDGRALPCCEKFSDNLLRLPLHCNLTTEHISYVVEKIIEFFSTK